MITHLKQAAERSADTLIADALAVASLFLLLCAGLLLPGLM